jgi:phosphomannomutase
MAGISGVRGVVGEGMTPEVALLWASGFGTWVEGHKVVVGRDSRHSGEMLNHAVLAGLTAAGCDVDDVGVVPTPVAALAVERRGAAGGIIITASHNPQEWNALKFVRRDGRMLAATDFSELNRIVVEGPLRSVGWDQLGKVNRWEGSEAMYIAAVTGLELLDLERIRRRAFRVALDCVNGAGSWIYPRLLETFGCEVKAINCTGSGIFPRSPEPQPESLDDLCELVVREKCSVGFAVDPDGDRLAAVDERGCPIGEENTLAIAIQTALEYKLGPIVVNSLTSQVMDDVASKYGVTCHRTRVGEANVASGMKEMGAVAGGEGNGGMILPALHYVRDAGAGMALLLNRLASSRKRLSDYVADLPSYHMVKSQYSIGAIESEELIEAVSQHYSNDQQSRIDGLRVVHADGWVQVRPSNTEPILRVFAESLDLQRAQELIEEMTGFLDLESSKRNDG